LAEFLEAADAGVAPDHRAWAQVMTGLGMDAGGKVYRIDDRQTGTPKWQERRDQLQKLGGPPLAPLGAQ
jgi:hypothetical protein